MLNREIVRVAPAQIVIDGGTTPSTVVLKRNWSGSLCRSRLANTGKTPVWVRQVTLYSITHALPGETALYGEGFQMLTQTGGTLAHPQDIGDYTDPGHYHLTPPDGAHTVYGLLTLVPPQGDRLVMAFTSCRRFSGRFDLYAGRIDVIVDTEGLELAPGATWDLEEFQILTGKDRGAMLDALAKRICRNHPPLKARTEPTGWCSWYCYGPEVTEGQIKANLDVIAQRVPALKYVQIDDGYQTAMGDWLETGHAFGGGVQNVLREIRQRGFEPAIWVAPFIAEAHSRVFQEHPDWFIKDAEGKPLRSDRVTFGGWRNGPWYALDGTHPQVQRHLESLFRTMNREWGCTYFKLDANFWGAMHGGHFYDLNATRVEAYRHGMEAILRGAGDSFLLGCNHPIWPSLGLIHGSRSSGDISRNWHSFSHTARENFSRNWQNGRLWWNDPDCLVLTGDQPEDEFRFHATAILATGGMLLSGDDMTQLSGDRLAMLRKLLPPSGKAAVFADSDLCVGICPPGARRGDRLFCLFNWDDQPRSLTLHVTASSHLQDFWTGEDLGRHDDRVIVENLPARSARLIVCTPIKN